jgi:hypothetical protein
MIALSEKRRGMKKLSTRMLVAAALVAVGVFAAPQSAMAAPPARTQIDRCAQWADQAKTRYSVQCHDNSIWLSDSYAAYITCDGVTYHSEYGLTPFGIGWGPWVEVRCPSGRHFTSAWYDIRD